MTSKPKLQFIKDTENKKITVIREFDAPIEKVWRAWTESAILDQWWAPKPYRSETRTMDFRNGGHWLYAMVGPDNQKQWCRADFSDIKKPERFDVDDAFCDENGKLNPDMPSMHWHLEFKSAGPITSVTITITFASDDAFEKIVEMGFQEGFTAGMNNLDEVLNRV